VNGAVAGKVRLVEFPANSALTPLGTSYYSAPLNAGQPATESTVREGMLESSNVSPVAAVVALISVQRHAEMLERALSSFQNDFNRVAVEDLPRV
jgi:flagellar basal-body rod protein FlgF/flagellar basal-body rod protein FlgG